jgi:hypothetical protein
VKKKIISYYYSLAYWLVIDTVALNIRVVLRSVGKKYEYTRISWGILFFSMVIIQSKTYNIFRTESGSHTL